MRTPIQAQKELGLLAGRKDFCMILIISQNKTQLALVSWHTVVAENSGDILIS